VDVKHPQLTPLAAPSSARSPHAEPRPAVSLPKRCRAHLFRWVSSSQHSVRRRAFVAALASFSFVSRMAKKFCLSELVRRCPTEWGTV
jgi:hypothetical protein